MKKLFFILAATIFLTTANSTSVVPDPKVYANEVYIPIGKTGKQISLQELSVISMKDLQELTGTRIRFSEKLAFKAAQRKIRNHINRDGTVDKKFAKKFDADRKFLGVIHLGGLALGLFLCLIGVLIAYLITTGDSKARIRWAWIGAAIALIVWGAVLI